MTQEQLTLFDAYPQAFDPNAQTGTDPADEVSHLTRSQSVIGSAVPSLPETVTVIETDVVRPDMSVYGARNRHILSALDEPTFDREAAIKSFEGLGVEIRSNNGLAGLHEARKENLAQFFTPLAVSKLIVDLLQIPPNATVLDNACGTGRLAWHLKNPSLFTGIEIEHHAYQLAKRIYPTAQLYNGSFLSFDIPEGAFDYVLLNPPFNLQLTARDGGMVHVNWEGHILSHIASLEMGGRSLKGDGFLAAILPRNVWKLESTRIFHGWFLNAMTEMARIHLPKNAFAGTEWPCTLFIFRKAKSWGCAPHEYTLENLRQTRDPLDWWSVQRSSGAGQPLWSIVAEYASRCRSTQPVLLTPKPIETPRSLTQGDTLPITDTDEVTLTCVKGRLSVSPNGLLAALKLANVRANFDDKKYDYTEKRYYDLFKTALNLAPVWSGARSLEDLAIIQNLKQYGLKLRYTDSLRHWLGKKRTWYQRQTVPFEQWINARPKKEITANTDAERFQQIQPGDLLLAKQTVGGKGNDRGQLRIIEGKEYSVVRAEKDEGTGNIASIVSMTEPGETTWWASVYDDRERDGGYYSAARKLFEYFDLYRYTSEKSDWTEINVDRGVRTQLSMLYHQREKQFARLAQTYPFLSALYAFQRDDVIRLSLKDCVIDGSQQGLGKTRKAIAVALMKGVKRALFIVPPHLKKNWMDECKGIDMPLTVIGSEKDALQVKQERLRKDDPPRFYLITFTTLKKACRSRPRKTITDLLKKSFPLIAVDECHGLSNKLTQITQAVKTLRAKHKHFMSGTPIGNTVKNLWSIFDILYKSGTPLFPYTTAEYREHFVSVVWVTKEFDATLSQGRTAQQIPDVLDVKRFTQLIEGKILRRLKEEPMVRRDIAIPKPYLIEIEVIPAKDQLVHYKAHLEHFAELFKRYLEYQGLAEHKIDTSVVLAHLQHLQFCATVPQHPKVNLDGEFTYRGGRTQAQERVIELIQTHQEAGEKIILFTQRPDYCSRMRSWLVERQIESEIFTGEVSIDKRNKRLEAFKNGGCQVLLASIRVTDTGLNIPQANVAIIVEPSWKYSEIEQAFSRILRPQTVGQPKVYLIRNKGLIDMYLWQHCVSKRKANAEVLDYQENERAGGWTHWRDFIIEMLKAEGLM